VTEEGESGQPWRGYNPKEFGRHWGTPTLRWTPGTRPA
jgi:site-specific DNA-methyltransferase (adenine-specific)